MKTKQELLLSSVNLLGHPATNKSASVDIAIDELKNEIDTYLQAPNTISDDIMQSLNWIFSHYQSNEARLTQLNRFFKIERINDVI